MSKKNQYWVFHGTTRYPSRDWQDRAYMQENKSTVCGYGNTEAEAYEDAKKRVRADYGKQATFGGVAHTSGPHKARELESTSPSKAHP